MKTSVTESCVAKLNVILLICFCAANLPASVTSVFYCASTPPSGLPSGAYSIHVPWPDSFISSVRPTENDGNNAILQLRDSEKLIVDFPEAARIISGNVYDADLYLYNIGADTIGVSLSCTGNLVNAAWNENTITWNNAPSVAATPEITGSDACADEGYNILDVTSLIDEYEGNDSTYHGILINGSGNGALYISKDNGNGQDTDQQPYLVVVCDAIADDVPPFIEIQNPAEGVTSSVADVTISGVAFDDIALDRIEVDGNLATGLGNWQYELPGLADGPHTVEAVAFDIGGNSFTDTVTFIVDTSGGVTDDTPPTITIQNPADGITSQVANVTISGIANDDIDLASVAVNGVAANGLNFWDIDLVLLDGPNTIEAIATDNAGNSATDTIVVVINTTGPVDDTPPTISILNPADGTVSPVANVTLSGVAWDDIDLSNVVVRNDSAAGAWMPAAGMVDWSAVLTLIQGTNLLQAMATDNSGNTATDSIIVIYDPNSGPDNTPPTIEIQNPADGITSQVANVTISGIANDDVNLVSVTVNGIPASGLTFWDIDLMLVDGPNVITATATDSSGNTASDSITIVYDSSATPDTTPPTIVIENPLDWTVSPVADITVSGIAFDNVDLSSVLVNGVAPIGMTDWQIDMTLHVGTNVITAVATDNSDNSASDTINVIYDPNAGPDTTDPWIEIQSPADGSTSDTVWVEISGQATDDVNVASVTVNGMIASGLKNWLANVPLVPGDNLITAVVEDNSGNTDTDSIHVFYNAAAAPTIEITSPADGAVFPNGSDNILVLGTMTPGDYAVVTFTLNGGNIDQADLPNWKHAVTLAEGDNVLVAYVETATGLSAQDSITVTYDSSLPADDTPPELTITEPSDGMIVPEPLTNGFSALGQVSDNIGVASLSVRVESTMTPDWDVDLYDQPAWDGGPIVLALGVNRIIATATDFGGNVTVVTNIVTVTDTPATPDMVIDITPRETWNVGSQQTVITGKNFQANCRFYLISIGPTIEANPADVVIGGVKAYALFDVDGVTPGARDVMAVNTDGSWGISNDLFMVNDINDITNADIYTPWIDYVEPYTLTNNYNNEIVVFGSNFFNVQNIVFSNAAGFWFRAIDIDIERSSLTAIYCTAMCGSDLAPQGVPRATGLFDVYVTAVNDLTGSKADAVDLVAEIPPMLVADVTIELSNDYKHIIVKWNGPDNTMIYTNVNRYYSEFSTVDGNWDVAEGSATWPWVFDASGTESLYIHLCDSTGPDPALDAPYDVGKFDVTLAGGSVSVPGVSWVAPPFNLFDTTLKGTFKDQLTPEGPPPRRDLVQYQETFGGNTVFASYDANGAFSGADDFPDVGIGLMVIRRHADDVKLTFTGWVPTNSFVIGPIPKSDGLVSKVIWLNPMYPAPVALDASGLGASGVVTPAGAPPLRDNVYQLSAGTTLFASYATGSWVGGDDEKTLWPGGMFMLDINKAHTGSETNWVYPKPY